MTGIPDQQSAGFRGTLAVLLARVIIPLWLLTGAILKLVDLSPSHLPAAIIKWGGALGLDLMFVLRFTIAAELIVVGAMFLVPPLARWIGIVMLAAFVPVLVSDLMLGASSCGCFGAVSVSPWVTLVTDVTFFFGLLILGRGEERLRLTPTVATTRVLAVGLWTVSSIVLAFGMRVPSSSAPAADDGGVITPDVESALPADGYYLPDYPSWVGREFVDLDVAGWMRGLPEDLANGSQYVIFYRKDCEHCHELMELYFSAEPPAPTTAVAVPDRDGFPTVNVQAFPCVECRTAELPAGVDWFFQTPVLVRLFDGVVECVSEVDPGVPECLEF